MSDLPFNPVDVAVFVLVGVAIWTGYSAGFIATTYSLATWVLAAAAAIAFTGPASGLIEAVAHVPKPLASSVGFMLLIIVVETLFTLAGHVAIRPVVALVRRGPLNVPERILGIPPSAIRTLFILAVGITALVSLPVSSDLKAAVETSRFGRLVSAQLAAYQPQLQALTAQLGGVPLLVTKLGEDQTEKLDLPDGLQVTADPVAERQLFDLVNDERTQRGLATLVWDDRLVPVARAHSEEMFRLKYFGHQSPTTGSPFDRLKAARIAYSRAGENLAYAQSVTVAHQGLMDSPGHRENILRPEFTRIGIGVMSAGAYGKMVTQLFITP